MARGYRLTLREKKFLKKKGYDPKNFLRLDKTPDNITVLETISGKVITVER